MIKEFYRAYHPATDCREFVPADELTAEVAYYIIRGDTYQRFLYYAEELAGTAPTPNKSARVESRTPSGMGEWVGVRGTEEWFEAVAEWQRSYQQYKEKE